MRAVLLLVAVGAFAQTVCGQVSLPDAGAVDAAMRLANDYWATNNSLGDSGWARGAYNTGNQRAFRVLGERAYHDQAVSWGNLNQWLIGPEGSGNANAYCCGQTYIDLYRLDLQPLYLANITSNTDALVASSATNGWTWIDAFYMQGPTLARLGNLTGDTNYYSTLWLMYDHMKDGLGLFDSTASLWYRDDTYTNAVTPSGQKVFWSRGNGWVFAGLARVLQQMSTNSPHYQDYVTMFQTMAPAIKAVQGADGMWRSSLYDYNEYPNPETSGTGFFTYGMGWGVRSGLLPAADYTNTIALAWQGLTNIALNANGFVGWVQPEGSQPAPATATDTADFGVGAFLLACSEIYLMAPDAPAIRPWAGPDQTVIATNGDTVTIPLDASQTEIYKGTAVSYTWWEGTNNLASGVTASTTLALGSHVITLEVLGSDSVIYTDSMTVAVSTPLVAVYSFEGNALDSSGNGNNGTAIAVTYVAGKVGAQAAQFNGTNSYVGIPPLIQDDFTVALWVKTTDTGGTGSQWWSGEGLVDGEVAGTTADWGTAVLKGKFALGIGSPDTTFFSTNAINDGLWHHVAATRSNATGAIQLYVDGVLQTTGTGPTGSRFAPPGLRIGSIQTGVVGGFLKGTIDEVRLYANVLSSSAILSLYNTTLPPAAPTSLAATAGDSVVNLVWGQSASPGITTNKVYRSTTGSAGPYGLLASLAATTVYSDTAVVNGSNYFYAVTAVNTNGEGAMSSQVSATPQDAYVLWQLQYFRCSNCPQSAPDADPLGKGFSNTNQFLLGLNPTNSASVFRIISAVLQGNNVNVTWQTAGGRTNAVQVAGGDASAGYSNGFADIPGSLTILPDSGDMVTNYTDIGAATNSPIRFYRIRFVPQ